MKPSLALLPQEQQYKWLKTAKMNMLRSILEKSQMDTMCKMANQVWNQCNTMVSMTMWSL